MNDMKLSANSTLTELQFYMNKISSERGIGDLSIYELWLLFIEEIGELSSAIRSTNKLLTNDTDVISIKDNLEDEFADVLYHLVNFANILDVNLSDSFIKKEIKNKAKHTIK